MGIVMPRQTSFVGGEISAQLGARSDLDRYHVSLKRCRNFLPTAQGAAPNRPGTAFIAEVKDSSSQPRLVRFKYSETQTFVLEFGDEYIRFFTQGGQVLATGAPAYAGGTTYEADAYVTYGGATYRSLQDANVGNQPDTSPLWWVAQSIYEIGTTYAAADLERLKFAQSGDTIFITHQGYPIRVLRRLSNIHWTISDYDIGEPANEAPNLAAIVNTLDTAGAAGYPLRDWKWVITCVDLVGEESLGFEFDYSPTAVALPSSDPTKSTAKLSFTDLNSPFDLRLATVAYNVYRGRNGVYGFLGQAKCVVASGVFHDDGQTPDYSIQPPRGTVPWSVGNRPACVALFDQRLFFADSQNEPEAVWGSKVAGYPVFDRFIPIADDGSLKFNLASLEREEVRSVYPGLALFLFTSSGVWAASGVQGGPLTPTSIEARSQCAHGASWLDPIGIGNVVLFVQEMGSVVRDLGYSNEAGGYPSADLTVLARHLFQGYEIVSWAYAREPYSVVWAVRDDGVLLSFTYLKEQQVWAWAWHDTDGEFESVCAVPEGDEYAVYVVVKRTIAAQTKRYVERFATRQVDDIRTGVFSDAAVSYNGTVTGHIAQLDLDDPDGITAGSTGTVVVGFGGPVFSAGDVGAEVWLLASTDDPVKLLITAYTDATHVDVELVADLPDTYIGGQTNDIAIARSTFTGLDHLEGEEVVVLADGAYEGTADVLAGSITIEGPAVFVVVGLRYASQLQLLDLALPGSEVKAVNKNVRRVAFEVTDSRGLEAGPDFDHLTEWAQRDVSDSYATIQPDSELVEVLIESTWEKSGTACLQHDQPLPLTVLSAVRLVEIGGP